MAWARCTPMIKGASIIGAVRQGSGLRAALGRELERGQLQSRIAGGSGACPFGGEAVDLVMLVDERL